MSGDNDYTMGDLAAPDTYSADPETWAGWASRLGGQAKAGLLMGLRAHVGSYQSPADELTGTNDPETRQAQAQALENLAADVPKPQGAAERYTRAVAEALGNPGSYIGGPTAPLWSMGSSVSSETLGHAYEGTPYERAARFVGGFTPYAGAAARSAVKYLPEGVGAFGGRIRQPDLRTNEPNPRATIGGNMPPEEFQLKPEEMPVMMGSVAATEPAASQMGAVAAPESALAPRSWAQDLPRPQPAAKSTDIPDIRDLSVADAIDIARTQPHLIRAGEQSPGYYVGAPRDIQSKRQLNAQRKAFDEYVAADPRGADWYDRQRGGIDLTTGGDPVANEWQSKLHGQFSAGVDPGSELHFVLKENNAALAGMPVKAARPAQHEAVMRAIEMRDPNQLQLGDKTWEYADKSNINQTKRNAVGVNDYRYAYQQGFRNAEGDVSKDALTDAQHKWLDMETALAVDRANRANLGGRSDWTGEQLQAAPWVRQKAIDIMNERGITYEEAYQIALASSAEHMPKHTFFATHEAQPGANIAGGHMMGSVAATQDVRDAFALDPRSNWATAPMGRDAIYSGLGIEGTGVKMRVLPSIPMRGMYTTPEGNIEFNLGQVARPLGTFTSGKGEQPFKRTTEHDQAILNAGEAVRALVDAQHAGAWHKYWTGGTNKESTSLRFLRDQPATEQEMLDITKAVAPYGMGNVVDTGQGITATNFGAPPPGGKVLDQALRKNEFNQFGEPLRVRVGLDDAGYISYTDKYKEGIGSGAATREMLSYVNKTPELRAAFNNNADIGERALARLERDKEWAARWGAPREDIQNLRQIIGTGKGWVDAVEAALKAGAILPATAAAIFAAARQGGQQDGL